MLIVVLMYAESRGAVKGGSSSFGRSVIGGVSGSGGGHERAERITTNCEDPQVINNARGLPRLREMR